jgi:prevent-host-death family protein
MAGKSETVNIAAAKARLPELVERAANGEEIILARHGRPRARLTPIAPRTAYVYGAGKGKWRGTDRVLDAPLPDAVLKVFEGDSPGRGRRQRG